MNIFRGSFRQYFILFIVICLSDFATANTHCSNPITEEDIERQCDNMIADFKIESETSITIENVVQSILGVVNIGDKGTFGLDRGFRVSRIEIALFGESEEELLFDELRNYGDHLNRDLILVKSCQATDDDKPGDFYATASVQIFLEEIDEYSVTMMAKETDIYSGESSVLSLKLSETGCPKEGETITLKKEGPGSLPRGAETNRQGRAQVQFQGEEEGETKIEALYEEWNDKVVITTRPLVLWDIDCEVYSWDYDPDYPRTVWNDDHWRSKVIFVDLPLNQLAETDYTVADPEAAESPANMNLYFKWLRIKKFYESRGSFYDSRITVYDGEVLYHAKIEADPEWILGFGTQLERFDYSQRREDEEGLKMFIFFKLKTGTIVASVSEKAGVKTPWFERFERRFRFPSSEILAGEPFAIDYEEPGATIFHSDVKIQFTPKEVAVSGDGGAP